MATQIISRKNKDGSIGHKIRVTFGNGMQKFLSLGSKYSPAKVGEIELYAGKAVIAIDTGEKPDKVTQCWLDNMSDDLRGRFIATGLIEPPKTITVGKLLDLYLREQGDWKDSTNKSYENAMKMFFAFFGSDKMTDSVTHNDCLRWKEWIDTAGYAEATRAGFIKTANTVFIWAVKKEFIELNPFVGVKRGSFINKEREHFVPMTDYYKLLDACPDQQWRTLLALCRIGGLRNPSETLALRWGDVNWEKGLMLVDSPKTGKRLVPLFPELRAELTKQFDQAEEGGSPFVITKWRDTEQNMRTHFERIVFRAGLQQWERLFHNLRGSRSNELFSDYPAHVASQWMGQSEKVARQHYLHATDADIQRAIAPKATVPADTTGIMAWN